MWVGGWGGGVVAALRLGGFTDFQNKFFSFALTFNAKFLAREDKCYVSGFPMQGVCTLSMKQQPTRCRSRVSSVKLIGG